MRWIGEELFINQRNAARRKRRVALERVSEEYQHDRACFSKIRA
jgi:hypothetical protein